MFAREFNIISNRYHEGHNQRERSNLLQTLNAAEEKFGLTQLFDPVACCYRDPQKEQIFIK
jgi:hypothetical protein